MSLLDSDRAIKILIDAAMYSPKAYCAWCGSENHHILHDTECQQEFKAAILSLFPKEK